MKLYKLTVRKGLASGTFSRYASSYEEAISGWLKDNPSTTVIEWEEATERVTSPPEKETDRGPHSPSCRRAYLKARVTQMMRNAQSILEDEDALVTLEERLQLSRVICQQNRILALWGERSMQLKLEGFLE